MYLHIYTITLVARIWLNNEIIQLFFSDFSTYLHHVSMCSPTKKFNGRKKSSEFFKMVKNCRIFGHIFRILKIFKFRFGALGGAMEDLKDSYKSFSAWTKHLVTRNHFRFSTCFFALNLKNSYLWKLVEFWNFFFCHQLLVYIATKWDTNKRFVLTPIRKHRITLSEIDC